jgi:hypothetical protein
MPTNPPSAVLEQQAREVLAAEYARDGHPAFANEIQCGNINRTGMGTAIRAMIAFRDAPQPAPEHSAELREKVVRALAELSKAMEPIGGPTFGQQADAIIALIPNTDRLVDPELVERVNHVADAVGTGRHWKAASLTGYDWRRIASALSALKGDATVQTNEVES